MRRGIWLVLLFVIGVPGMGRAQTPFDITNATTRPVTVYIDDNFADPSLVGSNLVKAFTGTWSSDGVTGTVTVPAANTIAVFTSSGSPGIPAQTGSWTDLEIDIDIASGAILDMDQSGWITITLGSTAFDAPFLMHLNTLNSDFFKAGYPAVNYFTSWFTTANLGDGPFPTWCSKVGGPGCGGQTLGPSPFLYDAPSGRFNAIGPIQVNIGTIPSPLYIYAYGTWGDAQLFEVPAAPIGPAVAVALMTVLSATGLVAIRRGKSA